MERRRRCAAHGSSGETCAGKYADFVDRTANQQAAFIDLVVFLFAYASGPYLFESAEQGWLAAGAVLDSRDKQVFVRDFLRKLRANPDGLTRVGGDLTPGELQVCSLLVSKALATTGEERGRWFIGSALRFTSSSWRRCRYPGSACALPH